MNQHGGIMNHHITTAGHHKLLQRRWTKRIGAGVAAACCAMLGLALVARADVGFENTTKPMNFVLTSNANGSTTLEVSGEWIWPATAAGGIRGDCNVDRYAIGWAVDWKDNDPAAVELFPGGPKVGDSTSIYPGTAPATFQGHQKVFYYTDEPGPAVANPRCGVTSAHVAPEPVGTYPSGKWGPLSHTYAPGTTTFSACVVMFDLKGPGQGNVLNGAADDGGFQIDRRPIAGSSFGNTDNSAQGNANLGGNRCTTQTFVKPNLTTNASAAVTPGGSISDTATLSNVPSDAGGTVTFSLYGPADPSCSGPVKATSAGRPLTSAGVGSTASSGPIDTTGFAVGAYSWVASYTGGKSNSGSTVTNYTAMTAPCGAANETVNILPPTGDLILRKEVDRKVAGTPASFVFSVSCLGSLPVTVTVPVGQTSFETQKFPLPSGTKCIVTEVADGSDSRYTLNLSAQEVTITSGSTITVTVSNTEKRGAVIVKKVVVGSTLVNDPKNFAYILSCDGVPITPVSPNDGVLTANETEKYGDIALGTKCSVVESPTTPDVFTPSYDPAPAEVTVTSADQTITITNTRKNIPMGKLRVHKVVDIAPQTDANFDFEVVCTNPSAKYTLTATIFATSPVSLSADTPALTLPVDSSCVVKETLADSQYTLNPTPSLAATIRANETSIIEITNTRRPGKRVFVRKNLSGIIQGDLDLLPIDGFSYELTCGNAAPILGKVKPFIPVGHSGFSAGTVCNAIETGVPPMFTASVSGPVIVSSAADQTIVITNTRRFVSVPVIKKLSGGVGPATLEFTLKCTAPVFEPPVLVVTVAQGQTSGTAEFTNVPAGASCTVSESKIADGYSGASDIKFVAGIGDAPTFTNTRIVKPGTLLVEKKVNVAPTGTPAKFSFSVDCPPALVKQISVTIGVGELTGSTLEGSAIAAGTKCTVTETPPDDRYSPPALASQITTIAENQQSIVTFVNNRLTGIVKVKKLVRGNIVTDPASFAYTLVCDGVPVLPSKGNGNGELTDGETESYAGIETGTFCVASEPGVPLMFAASVLPAGVSVVTGDNLITITNTRKTGKVKVEKVVVGGFSSDPTSFAYSLTCDGKAIVDGTVKVGDPQTTSGIETGAICTASEPNPPSVFTASVSPSVTVGDEVATITITNTRKLISVPVTKKLIGGVGPAEFGFTLKCVTPTFEPGQLLVTVPAGQTSGTAEFTNVPAGASCTVSETKIADGYSGASDIKFVAGVGDAPSFTNTRIVKPGTLLVEKKVNVPPTLSPATFTFSVDCPPAAKKQISVMVGIGELTGSTVEGSALPAGTNCTVTETVPDDRYSPPDPLSQKATISENQQSIVSFLNSRLTGTVKVTKVLRGPAVDGDQASFPYTLTCNGLLVPSSQGNGNGELTNGETESYVGIPTGSVCVTAESAPLVFSASIDPAAGVKVVLGDNSITITNTRKTGKLVVEKTVTSPPVGKSASFTFSVDCPGMKSQTISVTVDPGTSKGSSMELLGIPIGVICKVTEQTADGRYSRSSLPVDSQKVQELTTAFARFTNTRLTGKVIVEKVVSGGFDGDPDTFKYTLSCDGMPIVVDGIVKVGAPQTTSGIETGTICTASEPNPPSVFTASVSPSVTVGSEVATITITNTRKVVSIPVSKTLQGGVGPAAFGFTLNCSNPPFGPITKTITIADSLSIGTETFKGVPLGANCTVAESSTDPAFLPATGAKTLVAGLENPTAAFTNTKKIALVDLVKTADRSTIRPNEEVNYKVEITNRGNYDLKLEELTVKDDHCTLTGPTESVGTDKILSVGETWTYNCKVKVAVDTTNKATLQFPGGSREATKFVDVINPGIQITKEADKTTILSGTSVTYTYKVTNAGDDPLSKVSLQDDICAPAVYGSGDTNSNAKLEKPEEWRFTCKQALTDSKVNVQPNTVFNTVTATSVDSLDGTVSSDKATASVVIIHPSIALRKSASATTVHANDEPVTYSFVVSNTGDSPVGSLSVVDDKCKPLSAPTGDTNNNAKLDVGEFWTYTCTQTLSITTTNTAKANGKDEIGNAVTEKTATATVAVIKPAIAITKSASSTDVVQGASVTYTYKVTNPGDVALGAIVVSDDKCSPLTAPVGDTNNNAKLETTETWIYTCTQSIGATTTNTATVKGVDPLERLVNAQAKVTVTATTTTTTTTTAPSTTTTTTPTTTTTTTPALIPAPPVTTTSTTITAAPVVAALVFQPVAAPVPVTSTQAPSSTTTTTTQVIAVIVPASVLAASLPQAPPPNVLGVQISKTEPAFTGSSSSTQMLVFLGLIALSLGALLLFSPRRRSCRRDQ
jgi:uncharacterized repeat protein (TIGR01451 family)